MTQEDKNLLLRDLCARLPYGLKCDKDGDVYDLVSIEIPQGFIRIKKMVTHVPVITTRSILREDVIKPYLRPISSITEEEVMEWAKMKYGENSEEVKNFVSWKIFRYNTSCTVYINFFVETEYGQQGYSTVFRIDSDDCESIEFFDWLNAHHFDYRGLIRKKIALPADNIIYSNINKNNE